MAIKYIDCITSLVLSVIRTQISSKGLKAFLSNKSVDKLSQQKLKELLEVYENKNEIQKLWNRFLKFNEFYKLLF